MFDTSLPRVQAACKYQAPVHLDALMHRRCSRTELPSTGLAFDFPGWQLKVSSDASEAGAASSHLLADLDDLDELSDVKVALPVFCLCSRFEGRRPVDGELSSSRTFCRTRILRSGPAATRRAQTVSEDCQKTCCCGCWRGLAPPMSSASGRRAAACTGEVGIPTTRG